jgi:hypothetical protein
MSALIATFLFGLGLGVYLTLRVVESFGNGPLRWRNWRANRALRDLRRREEGWNE